MTIRITDLPDEVLTHLLGYVGDPQYRQVCRCFQRIFEEVSAECYRVLRASQADHPAIRVFLKEPAQNQTYFQVMGIFWRSLIREMVFPVRLNTRQFFEALRVVETPALEWMTAVVSKYNPIQPQQFRDNLKSGLDLSLVQKFYVWEPKFPFLPSEIGSLTHLEEVTIVGPMTFPDSMSRLTQVHELILNSLAQFPLWVCSLVQLTRLSIQRTPFEVLPDKIFQLTRLRYLNFSRTALASFSESFCALSSLTSLSLMGNKISSFPTRLSSLVQLKELHLQENFISEIPVDILYLTNLERLNLLHNPLTSVPTDLTKLLTGLVKNK